MADRLFAALFKAAVAAAHPERVIAGHLPPRPSGKTIVVGAGKAAAQMARALEQAWHGPLAGVVVTRYGAGVPCRHIEVLEAAHPVPDAAGLSAARRLLDAVKGLGQDDLVIALISGGGSALLPCPPSGMTLADEVVVNELLLGSGAPIAAMNVVRKHLSCIKGGRLAAAASPARVATLVVSDVPGDDPALVSSGPTVPDWSERGGALRVVEDFSLPLPEAALRHLQSSLADAPRPDDPRFVHNSVRIVASAALSLEAAAAEAERRGVAAVILSDSMEGEARQVAKVHAALAREVALRERPFAKPVLLLSGGETTVTLHGEGKGGRNCEFLLALAIEIDGLDGVRAFAADTDGIDGLQDNAGAFVDGGTAARLRRLGLDPRRLLADNDSWSAFNALGDLFVSGPTGTNVNDFRAIWIR